MSTSKSDELELQQRKVETKEEIIKIPGKRSPNSGINNNDEPGPLTKQKLISLMLVLFSVFLDFMGVSIVQPILPFYA